MSDRYIAWVNSSLGKAVARRLGLPQPARLDRYLEGNAALTGPTLIGHASGAVYTSTIQHIVTTCRAQLANASQVEAGKKIKCVIYDASGISSTEELEQMHRFFSPLIKRLSNCARLVVIGLSPISCHARQHVAQRAILGFVKSLAKEMRGGATVNLICCTGDCDQSLAAPLLFFASDRSAYVTGQVISVAPAKVFDWQFAQPLVGKSVLITGAARGIGLAIARIVKARGGNPICVDIPGTESDLRAAAYQLDCEFLALDITAPDAGNRISSHFSNNPLHAIVHNAGITRDKKLVNLKPDMWQLVLRTNISSQEAINEQLITTGTIASGGRIVSISSISGIAGNAGQTNYATSKAAVIGMVEAYCRDYLSKGITINAVAPGFIETKMVQSIPFAMRQLGRRLNSLSQGGQPADVAEAVSMFLQDSSQGLTGNVLRVCGQALIGA